ncbi:MAG: L-threonylcarbamoyladenylate synthase [Nanoarchaeota archaeon]|nr:L-threonylcarbamoyladenylate synthase [Nanoarchaeota archaeon]
MAKIIKLEKIKEKEIIKAIKQGKIIIYPTDTVYGIGCDALNSDSVLKIRMMKGRDAEKPFSVIAPSKKWVCKNFEVNNSYIQKLPGPFTFILKAKKEKLVSNQVSDSNLIAVRIPDHPITGIIQKANTPFVTTSLNMSGEQTISDIKKIPNKMQKQADIIIDAGILISKPSTIIDLTGKIARIIPR